MRIVKPMTMFICMTASFHVLAVECVSEGGCNFECTETGVATLTYCDKNVTEVVVPSSVSYDTIETYKDSEGIEHAITVSHPCRVTTIGAGAFAGCGSLKSVKMPDTVTCIGGSVFSGCGSLESVVLPNGIEEIGDWTFYECRSLTGIQIPHTIKRLGEYAFAYSGLASIDLPIGLVELGQGVFEHTCLETIVIPEKIATIPAGMFSSCESLKSIVVPPQVSQIGDYAFYFCTALVEVEFSPKVNGLMIGGGAFCGCFSLLLVELPDGTESIGYGAFSNCLSLQSIKVPASVKFIGEYVFFCNELLTDIQLSPNNVNYTMRDGFLCGVDGTLLAASRDDEHWYRDYWEIPEGISRIGDGALAYMFAMECIEIPDGVTSMGNYALFNCISLESVTIPASVNEVGICSFEYCDNLTNVTFKGDAPKITDRRHSSDSLVLFQGSEQVHVYVRSGTSGWGFVPGVWNERPINWLGGCESYPSNVRAQQRKESNLVDVYYDLEVPSGEAANISLSFIGDNGNSPATSVTGDVGDGVYAGKNRHIVWDAGIDWPGKTNDVIAVVTGSEEARSAKFRIKTEKFAVSDVRCDYFHGEYGHRGRRQTFLSRVPLTLRVELSGGMENHPVDHYLVNGKKVYDREYDLDVGSLDPGEHLEVIAVDHNGEKSEPFIANFDMARVPRLWDYDVRRFPKEHRIEYWSTEFDTMNLWDGLDTYFTLFDVDVGLTLVPSLHAAQSYDSSTGEFREGTSFSGSTGVFDKNVSALREQSFGRFAEADIKATLSGGTVSRWNVNQQRWVESFSEYGVGLSGEFTPLAFRIPQTLNLVYVKGGFQVSGDFTVTRRNNVWVTNMDFDPLAALKATVGAGLEGVACVEGYGKGGVVMHATIPGDPRIISQLGLQGEIGWRCMVFGFERSDHATATHWIIGGPTAVAPARTMKAPLRMAADAPLSDFTPISRDYLNARPRKRLLAMASPLAATAKANPFTLVEGGYPSPSPSLTAQGVKDHLVYLRDNENRSALNRTELVYRLGVSNDWQNVQTVWDDGTADFMPSIGVDGNGKVVATWVNGKTAAEDSSGLADMIQGMEIAVGVRDSATGTWTCQNLTDNDVVDMVPHLKMAANGSAAVVWMRNTGNGISGTKDAPSDLMMAFYRNGAWSEVKTVVPQAGVVTTFDVAYDGSNFCLAYTLDDDGNISTRGDEEIWSVSGTASRWGEPKRLTEDEVEDSRPFTWYANGTVQIAWLHGQKLMTGTLNSEADDFVSTNLFAAICPAGEFKVVPKGDQATFVWQCEAEQDHLVSDIASAEYDVTSGAMGPVSQLLATEKVERNLSGAVGVDGAFRMAYESVEVSTNEEGRVVYGEVDLNVYRVESGCDVGLLDGACSFAEGAPVADETGDVMVKIENFRNTAVGDVCVRVYWGEGDGLRNITTQDVHTNLSAKSSVVVSVPCYFSSGFPNAVFTIEVDPLEVLPDVDRSNNTLVWRSEPEEWNLAFANVSADSLGQDNWIISVDVANYGGLPLQAGEKVRFWRGEVGGVVIGEDEIGLVRANGGRAGASIEWSLGGQTPTTAHEEIWVELVSGKIATPLKIELATSLDSDGDGVTDAEEILRSRMPTYVGVDTVVKSQGGSVEASGEWATVSEDGTVDETHVISFERLADIPAWIEDYEITVSYAWVDRDGVRHEEGGKYTKAEVERGATLTIHRQTVSPLKMTLKAKATADARTEVRSTTIVLGDEVSRDEGTAFAVQWCFTVKQCSCGLSVMPDGEDGLIVTGFSNAEEALDENGALIIPAEIDGRRVTQIGSFAFDSCNGIVSVVIPEGVEVIGKSAFAGCFELVSVVIASSVQSIGNFAFSECDKLRAVSFHGDMPGEFDDVFGRSGQPTIYIREGTIGWGGVPGEWCGCSLGWWDIYPEAYGVVKSAEKDGAVWRYCVQKDGTEILGCDDVICEQLVVPGELDGYKVVGVADYAFAWLMADAVTISEGVRRIGRSAFWESQVCMVAIPASVTHIGDYAFGDCWCLREVCFAGDMPETGTAVYGEDWDRSENVTTYVREGTSGWGEIPGEWCGCPIEPWLDYPELPKIVEDGVYAVSSGGYEWTVSVVYSSEVWIGNVFEGVTSGPTISPLPQGRLEIPAEFFGLPVVGLADRAFEGCEQLACVFLPSTVFSVGQHAFHRTSLQTIELDEENLTYKVQDGFLMYRDWPAVVLAVGKSGPCVVPDGVEQINDGAFASSPAITELMLPKSVEYFGASAVDDCKSFRSIVVAEDSPYFKSVNGLLLDREGTSLVVCPGGLSDVVIPDGVRIIGWENYASMYYGLRSPFPVGSKVRSITLPRGVEQIADGAFSACESLTEITVDSGNAVYTAANGLLMTADGRTLLACAGGCIDVVIPDGVTEIGGSVFAGSFSLHSVAAPASVQYIGAGAFSSCYFLTAVCFEGDAPEIEETEPDDWFARGLYDGSEFVTTYVRPGTSGWGEAPGTWHGHPLKWWTSDNPSPIPELDDDADVNQVYVALHGSKDDKLVDNILMTCLTEGDVAGADLYNNYRLWAWRARDGKGDPLGLQAVRNSPTAWTSFALDQTTLLERNLTDEDLKIEEFKPSMDAGTFDFTVSIKDVKVGPLAMAENLKKTFGLEGATELVSSAFNEANVDIEFGMPMDGKLKFTAEPLDKDAKSFFMKMSVK